MKKIQFALALALLCAISLSSCIKKNFDGPPDTSGNDPHLPVNMTISQLTAMAFSGGYIKIQNDSTIMGIVVADDRSGNFYKQFVIQDSTGGIAILINSYNLYGDYPVGRKVYIKLKGLYIGNYHGLPQLGYALDNTGSLVNIPGNLAGNYVVKANFPNPVPVRHITLAQALAADRSMLNTLITIDSVMEFNSADAGLTKYAQPVSIASATDVYAEDCNSNGSQANMIDVRTSGYALFANYTVPSGRGSLTGILTVYNSTPQLIIRDTTDVQFTGPRCGNSPTASGISIDSLRKMYHGSDVSLNGVKISGTVISDNSSLNFSSNSKTIYLQDGDRGVSIFFSSAQSFVAGDSISVTLSGGTLTSYNGVLEVKGISAAKAVKVGDGHPNVRQVNIGEINAHYSNYESTLVKIVNATIDPGTFGDNNGNKNVTDGSGNITLFTASAATALRAAAVPSGPRTITAVVNAFGTTYQLQIRTLTDIQ